MTTITKRKRVVLEETEEVQTIQFFDNRFQSEQSDLSGNVKQTHDSCTVPIEHITLREDVYGSEFESRFDETVNPFISINFSN